MSTPDFFQARLDAMIGWRHPLTVLANRMPWTSIEATLTPIFEGRAREGRVSEEIDLFGVAGGLGHTRCRASAPVDPADGRTALPEARVQRNRLNLSA
jgi:hypothetical protein